MKFVIACQKIEVTGVLPTCEVVGMTLWPKIKWVVAHTPLKKGWYSNKNAIHDMGYLESVPKKIILESSERSGPIVLYHFTISEQKISKGSKIGKKCNFKSTKTHYLLFEKWQKNQFLHF